MKPVGLSDLSSELSEMTCPVTRGGGTMHGAPPRKANGTGDLVFPREECLLPPGILDRSRPTKEKFEGDRGGNELFESNVKGIGGG